MTNTVKISTDTINGVPVMKVEGRINATHSPKFIASLTELQQHIGNRIVLDLQKTVYIDSAAVGKICMVHIECQKSGKRLEIIVDPSPNNFISNLITTTGLKTVLNITRI